MAERRSRFRRLATGCLLAGAGLVAAIALFVGGGTVWLGTRGGNDFLARQLEKQVESRMCEGDLRIGGLDTDVFGTLVVTDVALTDGDGDVLFGADRLVIRYDVWPFLSRRAQIDELIVDGAVVDLEADEQGLLDLQRAFCTTEPPPESDEPWAGLPIDFDADTIRVHGARIRYRTPTSEVHLVGVDLVGEAHGSDRRIELVDVVGDARVLEPVDLPVMLRGSLAYTGEGLELDDLLVLAPGARLAADGAIEGLGSDQARYDLSVDAAPLDLDLIQRMTGMEGDLRGVVEGKVELTGPADALRVRAQLDGVDDTRGRATVDVTVDTTAEGVPWKGTVEAEGLRVEDFYEIGETGIELTGKLTAEGRGTSYPEDLTVTGRYEGAARIERPDQVIQFDRIEGDLELREGELGFRDVKSEGPLGRIGATGTLDLQTGELVVDASGLVDLMGLEQLGIEDLLGGVDVSARVSGNVLADELVLEAQGTARAAPFEYGEDVRFERLVATFDWWLRGDTQHVDAHVVAEDGIVYDAAIDRLETDVAVHFPPTGEIGVEGVATLAGVDYGAIFDAETARGEYAVTLPADREAPMDVTARFDIGPHRLFEEFPGTGGTARIALADDVLSYDVELQATYGPLLDLEGTYGLEDQRVAITDLLFAPTPRQAWRGEGTQTFTVTDGGIADASIAIASPTLGSLAIEGTVGTEGPLDAEIVVKDLQLDVFAELFPEDLGGLSGVLDLETTLAGTAEDPQIAGLIDATSVWLPGVSRWLDVEGAFEATRRELDVAIAVGAAGEPLLIADGVIPVDLDLADPKLDPDGRIDLALVLEPGDLARFENLVEQELGLPEGRISAVLSIEGLLRDPNFGLTGVLEADVEGWGQRARVEFDVLRAGDRMDFWAAVREGFESRGLVSGEGETRIGEVVAYALGDAPEPDWDDWTLWLDDMEARVAVLGTPVESLLALAGDPIDAEGDLLGGFVVSGSPLEPTVTGAVNWVQARIGGVDLPGAYFALIPAEDGYDLDVALQFAETVAYDDDGEPVPSEEPTGDLTVSGRIPLRIDLRKEPDTWTTGELALTVGGTGVPLDLFSAFDPGITEAEGLLVVEGTVGGDPLDPEPDLRFALADGSVAYQPLGVRFVDIDLDAEATASRVQLRNLSAGTEPIQDVSFQTLRGVFGEEEGRIVAKGSARLQEWTPHGVNFRMELDEALLSYTLDQVFRLSTPTAITAQGDWPDLRVEGEVVVDQGLFVYDATTFGEASPFELHSDLVVHRTGVSEEEEEEEVVAEEEPPIYANFDVDVRIDLNRAMEVRAELPFIDDYGALGAAVSTADVVARLGSRNLRVEMRNGELVLLNEVEIVEGQVGIFRALFDISGGNLTFLGDPTNPIIDIVGDMTVSAGIVTVLITGTPESPEIQFRSDQYNDQTEIFTILLTGRSPEELSNTEGASTIADAGALLFNSVLGQARTHSLSIDPDGRIRGSIPIPNRDVHAQFTLDPLPDPDENWYTISAEVSLFRSIMLEAAWGSEHSWADVFWEYRF